MRDGRARHAADMERGRARGYTNRYTRIAVVTDQSGDLIEVHPPSGGSWTWAG